MTLEETLKKAGKATAKAIFWQLPKAVLYRPLKYVTEAVFVDARRYASESLADRIVAKSLWDAYPLERIYDTDSNVKMKDFIEAGKEEGIDYQRLPITVDTQKGVNYKRIIGFKLWKSLRDEKGKRMDKRELARGVPAVFITRKYEGTRGNMSIEAVALIPKPAESKPYVPIGY